MNLFKKYCCLIPLLFALPLQASTLSDDLDQLIATLPPGNVHSIKVINAETGAVVHDRNGQFNLLPASTIKTITAISAYQSLGGDYRYQTRLLADQPVGRDAHVGDLVVSFSGDPTLTRADLANMLERLTTAGITTIKGNVWIDGSIYSGYPRAGGASWDDHNICFAAPVSAVILDHNCFYGWLVPAKIAGDYAQMFYDQPDWLLSVDSHVVTRNRSADPKKRCIQEVWPSSGHEYRLDGCIYANKKRMRMAFAVRDPEEAAARYVDSWLEQHNITLQGKILIGKPTGAFNEVVAVHQSEPVPAMLQELLKVSDNLYADSILKTMGHTLYGEQGSYASGTEAVLNLLRTHGVDMNRSRLVDGSGLSRYNMVSAEEFTEVLKVGWESWGEQAPWLAARSDKRLWLKTGYMSGVNAMVGYVFRDGKAPLIFAVILNGLQPEQPATRDEVKSFHDGIRAFNRAFLGQLAKSE